MKKLRLLIVIIAISLFLLPLNMTFAENDLNLPVTKINPGNFYYNFKRLWEKGYNFLNFSKQSKKSYYSSLLKTRLSELNYVVENKLLSEVQTSSERFAYYAGVLTELLEKSEDEEKRQLVSDFEKYSKFLDKLRDKYPANSSFWMLIQHDINTLKILSERLESND